MGATREQAESLLDAISILISERPHDIVWDFHIGAYGPTILVQLVDREALDSVRNLFPDWLVARRTSS
jgi:predicted deacylase